MKHCKNTGLKRNLPTLKSLKFFLKIFPTLTHLYFGLGVGCLDMTPQMFGKFSVHAYSSVEG